MGGCGLLFASDNFPFEFFLSALLNHQCICLFRCPRQAANSWVSGSLLLLEGSLVEYVTNNGGLYVVVYNNTFSLATSCIMKNIHDEYIHCINDEVFKPSNVISSFSINMSLKTPTSDSTPYIKVYFSGSNHNSWTDIQIITRTTTHKLSISLFDRKYLRETIPVRQLLGGVVLKSAKSNYPLLLHLDESNGTQTKLQFWLRVIAQFNFGNLMPHQLAKTYFRVIILLSSKEPTYILNVAGKVHEITIYRVQVSRKVSECDVTLKIYWLFENVVEKVHTIKDCKKQTADLESRLTCWNIVSRQCCNEDITSLSDSIFWKTKGRCEASFYEEKRFLSWKKASELCKAAGGFLPITRSRNELHELISTVKIIGRRQILEYIPIGLVVEKDTKVLCSVYDGNGVNICISF